MDGKDIFLIIALLVGAVLMGREAWKGVRTGAVDTLVKGSRVPVYAYRDRDPIGFWWHIIFYVGTSLAAPGLLLYLYVF